MQLSLLLGFWDVFCPSRIDWTWSEFLDLGDELVGISSEFCPFACAEIKHPDSTPADIDLFQYVVNTLHPRPRPEIAVDKMTVTLQTAHDHDAVGAVLKGLEQE
jgi:hypothetical protein